MMDKKRLVLFQPFIGPYRIDFTNDLSEAFDARIYMKYPRSDDQAFKQNELSVHLKYTPRYLPEGSVFKRLIALRDELVSFNPDIIVTFEYDIITLFILLWRWLGRRRFKVVGMSDDSFDMLNGNDFTRKHKYARDLLARHLDNIILVEPQSVEWYRKKFGKGFFFPIIRDEDVVREMYATSLPSVDAVRREYDLDSQNVFLFVGRLVELKNINSLIRAFSRLDQNGNKLVIVGDGPEKAKLKQLCRERGVNCLFTGRKEGESLHVWYHIADTLVLPSIQEAFGAVTNEALMAGCHAVVSRRAGSKCLVKEGENGFIINPLDEDDIYDKLLKSIDLPRTGNPLIGMRKNLMIYSYKELFSELCDMLYSA